jgi:hypothetical protein
LGCLRWLAGTFGTQFAYQCGENLKKLQVTCLSALLFGVSVAGSVYASTGTGKIVQIAAYRSPAVAFVLLDSQPTLASCANNSSWTYVLPMNTDQDKKLFAMLLEARSTGRIVTITGTGACADFAGIESASYILTN